MAFILQQLYIYRKAMTFFEQLTLCLREHGTTTFSLVTIQKVQLPASLTYI